MLTKIERVRELARIVGIAIAEDELVEVAERLESVIVELEKLAALDLSNIEPVTVFEEEDDRAQ